MAAAAVASPSPLMSPAAALYASKAQSASPSTSAPSSSKSKTSRIFRRVSRNIPSPFSSATNTPSLTSSPFSPAYTPISTPSASDTAVLAPCVAPAPTTSEKKAARRLSRKPVPASSPDLEAEEAAFLAARQAEQPRQKRARPSPRAENVVDGLWTTTCDARPDEEDDLLTSSPVLSHHSRRSSSASSSTLSTRFTTPTIPPAVADLAILLSTSARRASIPSPAALAGNAALSPRLARIAAFTSTVAQLGGEDEGVQGRGAVAAAATEHAVRLRNSFDLPEIELPWLPTLFPEGTPVTPPRSSFPSPQMRTVHAMAAAPPSPATSGATFYPLSLHSSHSSDESGSLSSSQLSDYSLSSGSTTSTLPTPPASLSPKTSPCASSFAAFPAQAQTNRKSMFRITTASGAHLILDLPSSSSLAPAGPTLRSASPSPSPRLPSLDFSPLRRASAGADWWNASSPSPNPSEGGGDKFVDALSTPLKEWGAEERGLGVSTSWVEKDDEDDGEVLVIALTPKLG
ncbi:hypothetical protein JCM6882_005569 [Rhodosporidiobolus microsporus]